MTTTTAPPIRLVILEGPDPATEQNHDGSWWQHNAYRVRLVRGTRSLSTPWKQGHGIDHPPTAADVLEALLSDAASIENAPTFEEWAPDLGYDSDSRRAEKVYHACQKQTQKLRRFLGDDYTAAVFPPFNDDEPYRDSSDVARELTEES